MLTLCQPPAAKMATRPNTDPIRPAFGLSFCFAACSCRPSGTTRSEKALLQRALMGRPLFLGFGPVAGLSSVRGRLVMGQDEEQVGRSGNARSSGDGPELFTARPDPPSRRRDLAAGGRCRVRPSLMSPRCPASGRRRLGLVLAGTRCQAPHVGSWVRLFGAPALTGLVRVRSGYCALPRTAPCARPPKVRGVVWPAFSRGESCEGSSRHHEAWPAPAGAPSAKHALLRRQRLAMSRAEPTRLETFDGSGSLATAASPMIEPSARQRRRPTVPTRHRCRDDTPGSSLDEAWG